MNIGIVFSKFPVGSLFSESLGNFSVKYVHQQVAWPIGLRSCGHQPKEKTGLNAKEQRKKHSNEANV